jgi:hypothetical protein
MSWRPRWIGRLNDLPQHHRPQLQTFGLADGTEGVGTNQRPLLLGLRRDLRRLDPRLDQNRPFVRGVAGLLQRRRIDFAPGLMGRAGEPGLEDVGLDALSVTWTPKPGTRAFITCFLVPSGAGLIDLMRRSVRVFLGSRAMVLWFLSAMQMRTPAHLGGSSGHHFGRDQARSQETPQREKMQDVPVKPAFLQFSAIQ